MGEHIWIYMLYFVHLLLSLSFHESAHGWMAWRLGDPTARYQGRITLNPLPHIDPIGTILLPLISMIGQLGVVFGWAKPTPVNPRFFQHPRRDHMLTALAGPVSNLLLAAGFAVLFHITRALFAHPGAHLIVWLILVVLQTGVILNVVLAVFNLLPVYPLDGSWVAEGLMPYAWLPTWYQIKPYMPFILLMLFIVPGFFSLLLMPPIRLILWLLGIPF